MIAQTFAEQTSRLDTEVVIPAHRRGILRWHQSFRRCYRISPLHFGLCRPKRAPVAFVAGRDMQLIVQSRIYVNDSTAIPQCRCIVLNRTDCGHNSGRP